MSRSAWCSVLVVSVGAALVFVSGAFAAAPPNDDFANAQAVSGRHGVVTGSNVGATREAGEPWSGSHSIWYRWRAPMTAWFRVDTFGSNFDTVLAVYRGNAVDALTRVVRNDDARYTNTLQSAVDFRASRGRVYRIAIGSFFSDTWGSVVLRWQRGAIIFGSSRGETLIGTPGNDVIVAGGGADTLYGRAGGDDIFGQGGADRVHGGGGADELYGGSRADSLYGGPRGDAIYGGSGSDHLFGGRGSDLLTSRDYVPRNDVVRGGDGVDSAVRDRGDLLYSVEFTVGHVRDRSSSGR